MNEQLIQYCERTSHAFWAEPWNAVTNAAFLVAALLAWMRWRRTGSDDPLVGVLIVVVTATGIGSFLWHTFATRWSLLTDTIPIAIFIYTYFWLAMRRFLHLSALAATLLTLVFAAASVALQILGKGALNGSIGYLPALAAMAGVSGAMALRHPSGQSQAQALLRIRVAKIVATAGFFFSISLFFRTIDRDVCGHMAMGTHFVWHIMNGCVLYLLIHAATEYRGDRDARIETRNRTGGQ